MKKFMLSCILIGSVLNAQFTLKGKINNYSNKRVIVKLNKGFEDLLVGNTHTDSQGNFSVPIKEKYIGILNVSLYDTKQNLEFISDNTNINFVYTLTPENNIIMENQGNGVNEAYQYYKSYYIKKNVLLDQISSISNNYKPNEDFYTASKKEIENIKNLKDPEYNSYPFLSYFINTLNLVKKSDSMDPSESASNAELIINHFANTGDEFETDGLGKTLLFNYIKSASANAENRNGWITSVDQAVQKLLDETGEDTNRGQEILSAVINIFNSYGVDELTNKYLNKAQSLTCELTPELKNTITKNESIQIGKKLPNIKFTHKLNGKYKSIYDVNSKYKIVMVWGSWCGHCQLELPAIKLFYENFKKSGGEIIGLAVDYDKKEWEKYTKDLPWLNDTELLYWDSKFVKELNITGTPTLFLLDKDNQILKISSKISDISNYFKN